MPDPLSFNDILARQGLQAPPQPPPGQPQLASVAPPPGPLASQGPPPPPPGQPPPPPPQPPQARVLPIAARPDNAGAQAAGPPPDLHYEDPAAAQKSDAAQRLVAILSAPRTTKVAASETPRVAPDKIKQLQDFFAEARAAQGDLATAQAHQAEDEGVGEALHADTLKRQGEETKTLNDSLSADAARKLDTLNRLSEDVANSKIVDPWARQSTGTKIRYTIANMFGAFASGFSHGAIPNFAMQQINQHIADDLEQQKQAIEAKKGRVADMKGILAETYRQSGNMKDALSMAHAIELQRVDAEQRAYAAGSKQEVLQAGSRLASAQLEQEQWKVLAPLFSYNPGGTVQGGGLSPKIIARAQKLYDDGVTNGKNVSFQDALLESIAENGGAGTGGLGSGTFGKTPAGAKDNPQIADQIAVADQAIKNIDALRDKNGELPGTGLVARNLPGEHATSGLQSSEARQLHGALRTLAESVAHANGQRGTEAIQYNLESIIGNGSQKDIDAGIARAKAIIESRSKGGGTAGASAKDVGFTPEADE